MKAKIIDIDTTCKDRFKWAGLEAVHITIKIGKIVYSGLVMPDKKEKKC